MNPEPLPRLERGEPRCARADCLHQEVEPDAALLRRGIGDGEGAGQVGPARIAAPARVRGQHVELAGGRLRACGVEGREDPIAAGGEVPGHLAAAPAEGGSHPLAQLRRPGGGHLFDGSRSACRCSSCSALTSASSRAAAKIAREAAEAPVMVVTQGIPWRTASVLISYPSVRAPDPVGVLITRSTSPLRMQSTTFGEPSPIFLILRTGTPIREIASAVP